MLLSVVTAERFAAEVLLLGIEGRHAWAWSGGATVRVALADLGPLWTGSYRYLWHPPAGFAGPLSMGDSGPAVAAVAELLARLDGQPRPLAQDEFNAALQQRVRLFQRREGLADDGVVGVQTLLALNRRLQLDPGAQVARETLAAGGREVPTP
ncbi:MAG: peptidoglycan-binding protein [Halioglobus sp.]|nr:peptidoglycan-binding protein [Halioglobus sp.]